MLNIKNFLTLHANKKQHNEQNEENISNTEIPFNLSYRAHLLEFLDRSTIHGIYDIYKVESILLKLFIGVCFLSSAGYCTYQVATTITNYLSYNVLTTHQVFTSVPAEFPVVAFCNQVRKTLKKKLIILIEMYAKYYLKNMFDMMVAFNKTYKYENDGTIKKINYKTPIEYTEALKSYIISNIIKDYLKEPEELYYLNFYLNQMLIGCRFQDQTCKGEDFMQTYDYYYGLCYRFNMGRYMNGSVKPVLSSGRPGWRYGLILDLFSGSARFQEKYIANRGFRILVFNRSNPYPIAQDIGVDVATGMSTNIAINREFTYHLPAPYSNCLPTDINKINWGQNEVLNFMFEHFVNGNYYSSGSILGNWSWEWQISYDQNLCIKFCFQKYLFETCDCYDVTLPKANRLIPTYTIKACSNGTQMKCLKAAENKFYNNASLVSDCYEKCPLECDKVIFF